MFGSFRSDTDDSSREKRSPSAVLHVCWTGTGMCLFGIRSGQPRHHGHRGREGGGDQEGKEHVWELAQHLGLQAFVTTCLKGEGGHGNYAKAMHYPDKVIHQIISHNFNSSLEFSLPLQPAGYCITGAVERVEH